MKFLVVYATSPETNTRPSKTGEPCVPNFWVCGPHLFLGLESDGFSTSATPAEVPDEKLDSLFDEYKKRYPSLPEDLLSRYFMASGEAAMKFAAGTRVKITHVMDDDTARIYSPETGTSVEVKL